MLDVNGPSQLSKVKMIELTGLRQDLWLDGLHIPTGWTAKRLLPP